MTRPVLCPRCSILDASSLSLSHRSGLACGPSLARPFGGHSTHTAALHDAQVELPLRPFSSSIAAPVSPSTRTTLRLLCRANFPQYRIILTRFHLTVEFRDLSLFLSVFSVLCYALPP